jgi:gas vesicle protein
MITKLKFYQDRDLDYYNPKPFVLSMISIFSQEDHKRLSQYVDNDLHYLFPDGVFNSDLLTNIKQNHLDKLIKEIKSVLNRKADNIQDEISNLENRIKRCQERIEENTAEKNKYTTQLEGLKNVIAKAARADN